jgi:hypothetical protein
MIKLFFAVTSIVACLMFPQYLTAAERELDHEENHLELWKTEIEPDLTLMQQAGVVAAQAGNIVGQIGNGCYHLYNASSTERADLFSGIFLQVMHQPITTAVDAVNYTPFTLFLIVGYHLTQCASFC